MFFNSKVHNCTVPKKHWFHLSVNDAPSINISLTGDKEELVKQLEEMQKHIQNSINQLKDI